MLLSPSQCSMIFTLVMTHAGSHSVAVGNKRTTDAPQWKCDLKKSMNDWAIHLSAASWRWQAGSSDKGAALTGERFTAFVLPQMRVMITRVGSSARLTVSMVLEWGIPLCVCVCVLVCVGGSFVFTVGQGGGWGIINRLSVLEKARLWCLTLHGGDFL